MLPLLLPLLGPILERLASIIPDPEARARALADAQSEMTRTLSQSDAQQAEVNKAEAASGSLFVAGWRPAIGWVCGGALVVEFLARPILAWAVPSLPPMPAAGEGLWVVVTGMLGLGGLRSFEKARGIVAVEPSAIRGGQR